MQIQIEKVKVEKQYKGAYARIFKICNRDSIFSEIFEESWNLNEETGIAILELSETPDADQIEDISKIKNVTIL